MTETPDGARDREERVETILVVEDEEEVRKVVCLTLELQGYRVMAAAGPLQALSLVEQRNQDFDLLLTDVIMPGLSGPGLYEAIHKLVPAARVLYISGYSEEALAEHGLSFSNPGFLAKPFSSATLGRKVRQVLRD